MEIRGKKKYILSLISIFLPLLLNKGQMLFISKTRQKTKRRAAVQRQRALQPRVQAPSFGYYSALQINLAIPATSLLR